ncbi:hypothetical protein Clacol_009701 [Clathrus columnatus]|uniref:SHSP domain-containing protein n=1 Tax=Clathrus columnatus TaxID=1419009 RepID=A0AAV5AQI6_9AGAM|nr:hypothetical protein Clacol_009701 [Clathrus columnatus]
MSLSRVFFNEFRPFFRLFDDVARSNRHPFPMIHRHFSPFDEFVQTRQPALDLSEHGNDYIVEAEVPGVKKENLEVRVGDNGRSLTIEGKILSRSHQNGNANATATTDASNTQNGDVSTSNSSEAAKTDSLTAISTERDFVGSSQFTRTVWLPRAIDASKINASLQDGILTLRIPKMTEEQGSVRVQIQ